jgi:glucose/arabinose dehydrogenase
VRLPDEDGDGRSDRAEVIAGDLNRPSSLAFHPSGALYVAETGQVWRLTGPDAAGVFTQRELLIEGLPTSGTHRTRTLLFSPDGAELYLSVGSSCNVCDEDDPRRAAILRYDPDGAGELLYAVGLRNAVGLAWQPGTDRFWASNNGRDLIGDDLPPDTIHLIRENIDYGWPRCHAGRIVDPNMGEPDSCDGIPAAEVELQAHSAPLGLTFYTGGMFPSEYRGSLFVAYHGSWNRREPTGYKIVRIPVEADTTGPVEDFAVGWLRPDGSNWGRPVDVITAPDGSLFVSDDAGGRVYRISYAP